MQVLTWKAECQKGQGIMSKRRITCINPLCSLIVFFWSMRDLRKHGVETVEEFWDTLPVYCRPVKYPCCCHESASGGDHEALRLGRRSDLLVVTQSGRTDGVARRSFGILREKDGRPLVSDLTPDHHYVREELTYYHLPKTVDPVLHVPVPITPELTLAQMCAITGKSFQEMSNAIGNIDGQLPGRAIRCTTRGFWKWWLAEQEAPFVRNARSR